MPGKVGKAISPEQLAAMAASAFGKKGGSSRSAAKVAAVMANGKLGGRPKADPLRFKHQKRPEDVNPVELIDAGGIVRAVLFYGWRVEDAALYNPAWVRWLITQPCAPKGRRKAMVALAKLARDTRNSGLAKCKKGTS